MGLEELAVSQIRDMGHQIAYYPLSSVVAAAEAIRQVYKSLLEKENLVHPSFEKAHAMVERLIGLQEYYEVEDRALREVNP